VSLPLLCLLLTSAKRSAAVTGISVQSAALGQVLCSPFPAGFPPVPHDFNPTFFLNTLQISQGKTRNSQCVNAGFIKHTPWQMEDFAVTCPLVPDVPHLVSGSCSSPRIFGLGFLQTPPRDDALALLLSFGSANTWYEDLHLTSYMPCLAHTKS
jgi:hypothetical protein